MNIFVGPSGELEVKDADTQRSINLMPTLVESGMGKAQFFLKPVPGLTTFSLVPGPASFVLTSYLYPIFVEDSADLTVSIDSLQVYGAHIGSVDLGPTLDSLVLTVTIAYQTYTSPPDAADLSATLDSMVLTVTIAYQTYTCPPEGADLTATLDSMSMVVVISYITYSNWIPEGADLTVTLDSLVLA